MVKNKKAMLKILALSIGMTAMLGFSPAADAAVHEVKKGETLYRIAANYKMTVKELKDVNKIKSHIIYPGQRLTVADSSPVYTVKKGDTLYRIAKTHKMSVTELKLQNKLTTNMIYIGQKLTVQDSAKAVFAKQVTLKTQKGYTFTKEEPGKYQLFSAKDGEYFVRIELLDNKAQLDDLKKNATTYLQSTGKVTEIKDVKKMQPFYHDAIMYYNASNAEVSQSIVVKKVNGQLVRFTLHWPQKEIGADITPPFLTQLQTLTIK